MAQVLSIWVSLDKSGDKEVLGRIETLVTCLPALVRCKGLSLDEVTLKVTAK